MMSKPWEIIRRFDKEVYSLIEEELSRQQRGLELIASENFASEEVIAALGSILNNKYAEGTPGKRYYGGCEVVDKVENLAISRLCQLFGAKFANVQAHSGAQANAAAFLALLQPGDKILGLDLSHGGHLTHGSKVNFSGLYYESHRYQVNDAGYLDYQRIEEQAKALRPKLIIAGASAYPRSIDFAKMRAIADTVGAYLLVDMAHIAGLVAAKLHQSPIAFAHIVTSTTHKTLRGPRGGILLWNDENLTPIINKAVFPGVQGGPLEHVIAAKAVCFKEALLPDFTVYQQNVLANCQSLAKRLVENGFNLVTGGSDNHLLLIDLKNSEMTGKKMETALSAVDITANKNTVPGETRSPFVTSGIRLGTPALTSRGMKPSEMIQIGDFIRDAYENADNPQQLASIKAKVNDLALSFPLYPGWVPS